jgi:hypothetical protein
MTVFVDASDDDAANEDELSVLSEPSQYDFMTGWFSLLEVLEF